jgi:hypothetical protein
MAESHIFEAGSTPPTPPSPPSWNEDLGPSAEPLEAWEGLSIEASREAERWNLSPQRKRCPNLQRASREAGKTILAAITRLQKSSGAAEAPSDDARWLVENRRLLRSELANTRRALKIRRDLPQIQQEDKRQESVPRAYAAAQAFLRSAGYIFDDRALSVYLAAAQEHGAFDMAELWSLRTMFALALLQEVAKAATRLMNEPGASRSATAPPCPSTPSMALLINSLRGVAYTPWTGLVEQMSLTEAVLREDPAGAYSRMDFESRDQYREVIDKLGQRSKCGEVEIAKAAIALARLAETEWNSEVRRAERRSHVGYYLVDHGRPLLEHQIGYRPSLAAQLRDAVRRRPDAFYLLGIELLTFAIMGFVLNGLGAHIPLVWALFLLLVPATESAVGAMNQLVSFLLPPRALPKLDFSQGIPSEFTTMVAVPTLLTSEQQVRQMVRDLELRYLGNQDPNLHFALLTDFPDSPQPTRERSTLVEICSKLIEDLNEKYRGRGAGLFYLFHRDLVYNPVESTWMGWERKRGKLLDFNSLLRGKSDNFPVKVGDLSLLPTILPKVRYVITLDADTQLPRDSARQLIGTLAHPLNRAVIDPVTNTVVEGYGILQPRVGISVRSVNRSRLASIYSGQAGLDIYSRAVSDVYQDLLDEGSFTGKGIYEVDVFQRVLSERFPLNTILSHDLIEGAYARAGLVSDIEVIDDYPSHFSAYSRRKHRWVRGDWQIIRWLLPRVPDYSGRKVKNPISAISKWKILDNLRRSLVEPATFVLLLAGWFFLPGGPAHWTLAVLALLLIPAYLRLILALLNLPRAEYVPGFLSETAEAFVADQVNVFMLLAFLAHQVLVTLDAIVRTVVRLAITRRRLLEWETAAEAEAGSDRRTPVDLYLELTPLLSAAIAALLLALRPSALPLAAPILVVWACSGLLSRWLNRPLRPGRSEITGADEEFLRMAALQTWCFFRSFSNEAAHWLIPDNVEEDPYAVAGRISPTNLGFLLNARIAACELGYLSLGEFVAATEQTLATMRRMARHRGHFFNWYDTSNLEPLNPLFVSTVDSGNLACCLWTLKQSCLRFAGHPVTEACLGQGVVDHVRLVLKLVGAVPPDASVSAAAEELRAAVAHATDGAPVYDPAGLQSALARLGAAIRPDHTSGVEELRFWIRETESRVSVLAALTGDPGPGFCPRLQSIAAECDALVRQMDFSFLYSARRKVLSIGYDLGRRRLEASCYELLASEARTAAFVAVAKGDIPQESWFSMGRTLTVCDGWRALLSWSGTMFEYLMPVLWMKSLPRTLLDESVRSAVRCQRRASKKTPWGISESGCSRKNGSGHYEYYAFGVPGLAMRPDPFPGTVISPYSSFLALAPDTSAAAENLRWMHELGWVGRYGFYEAADYSASKTGKPEDCEIVRSWMAHHQGMILLAVCNLLTDSAIQNLFHTEPMVAATERLLHERLPRAILIDEPELAA